MSIAIQLDWILRLAVAAFCGGLIGYERSSRLKNAGIRTHIIVAIASALIMLVSKYAFYDILALKNIALDPSRIAAQIISGISFIGAGTILVRKDGVNGITTAAGVWATAAVGMAIGGGLYFIGVVSALVIVLVQQIIRDNFVLRWLIHHISIHLQVEIDGDTHKIHEVQEVLQEYGVYRIKIQIISISASKIRLQVDGRVIRSYDQNAMLLTMGKSEGIKSVHME